jgi:hypothetical protein
MKVCKNYRRTLTHFTQKVFTSFIKNKNYVKCINTNKKCVDL